MKDKLEIIYGLTIMGLLLFAVWTVTTMFKLNVELHDQRSEVRWLERQMIEEQYRDTRWHALCKEYGEYKAEDLEGHDKVDENGNPMFELISELRFERNRSDNYIAYCTVGYGNEAYHTKVTIQMLRDFDKIRGYCKKCDE